MTPVPRVLPALLAGFLAALVALPGATHAQSLAPEHALTAALAANPSLRAALADAVAARAAARAADNGHRPVFVAGVTTAANERFSATTAGVARNADQQLGGSMGLQYTTDLGTIVSLDLTTNVQWRSVNRDPTSATAVTIPPTSAAQASVSARQPLLRGAGSDVGLADVRQANAAERQARYERDVAVSQLVRDVLSAYWELWYADHALAVQREALGVAERQREEARQRAEVLGTAARVDVLRFSAELATLREAVTTAEASRRAQAIELGRLLGVGPEAAVGLVAESPDPTSPEVPPAAALVASARGSSPELLALEQGVRVAHEQLLVADDGSLPRFDLVATAGVGGLWTEDPLPGLRLPGDRPALFGTLGLELELPFGPTVGRANLSRSVAQLEAAEQRYRARLQAIEAEIATRRQELDTARTRVALAGESAQIATELADAERQRLELGTTRPVDLVQAQQAAREAALRRLRALVDVVGAGLRLDHAAGRLLDRFSPLVPHREARPS